MTFNPSSVETSFSHTAQAASYANHCNDVVEEMAATCFESAQTLSDLVGELYANDWAKELLAQYEEAQFQVVVSDGEAQVMAASQVKEVLEELAVMWAAKQLEG